MRRQRQFPGWLKKTVERFCPEYLHESILGDLEEYYHKSSLMYSGKKAYFLTVIQSFKFLRPAILRRNKIIRNSNVMGLYQNYLKTSVRSLAKNRLYAGINLLGLSTGIASSFLVTLFVMDELSFDTYHDNANNIYRITQKRDLNGTIENTALTSIFLGTNINERFNGLNHIVRFLRDPSTIIEYENENYPEKQFCYMDAEGLEMFNITIVKGAQKGALGDPKGMVISEQTALKYFGEDDPIGKTLIYKNYGRKISYKVTAVMKDFPSNSHFRFDFLVPFKTDDNLWYKYHGQDWYYSGVWTYVHVAEGQALPEIENQLKQLVSDLYPQDLKEGTSFTIQPLTEIYLNSDLANEIEANSDVLYVYIFSIVAIMIMVIACINFMNLATARATQRTREIGMRKVIGASRKGIIIQFMGEAFVITFISILFSVIWIWLSLPGFNALSGKHFQFQDLIRWEYFLVFLLIGLVTALLSGFYPALLLSRFRPISVLKVSNTFNLKGVNVRRIMVIFQFTMSMILIVGIITISRQLGYMNNMELGFNQDRIVYIPIGFSREFENAKNELLSIPGVVDVSGGQVPGTPNAFFDLLYRDQSMDPSGRITVPTGVVYYNYLDILELDLKEGRTFSKSFNDAGRSCIVNESFVETMGWENAIGQEIYSYNMLGAPSDSLKVVGVVRNFNFQSLHNDIKPLVLRCRERSRVMIAKMNSDNLFEDIGKISEVMKKYLRDVPPEVYFLESELNKLYVKEKRLSQIMLIFTVFAIFISCLGLFGLASFTVARKAKEISIRKVLGASINSLLNLLTWEYSRLVFISFFAAIPVSYLLINSWLENFAFRIQIGVDVYLLSALIAITSALLTVGYHSLRAAKTNPVNALKDE